MSGQGAFFPLEADAATPARDSAAVQALLSSLSPAEWQSVLLASMRDRVHRGVVLPGFPPDAIQRRIVGSSGEDALREAFTFYTAITRRLERFARPLHPDSRVLDFGCGWGRILRFFLRDVRQENLFGVDAWQLMIDTCRETMGVGQFDKVEFRPPLPRAHEAFDLIFAYSVFTHMAEDVQLAWIDEFARALRPGGLVVLTVWGRGFIDYCESVRRLGMRDIPWHDKVASAFPDVPAAHRAYDDGRFQYVATGGGPGLPPDVYGEAVVPPAYIERHWTRHLELKEFTDDRAVAAQAVVVLAKPA